MNYKDEYKRWCESDFTDKILKSQLCSLTDEKEIEDRFYKRLEFGTAGLRGILGAGTNRMNVHTVRQATKALADYIKTIEGADRQGVAIAYDTRMKSSEFAKAAALVLCENGIKTYLFKDERPVPMLSFSVRYLKCIAGIVITASHNPPEYNGYKVYWQDGGQITPDRCKIISEYIDKTDVLSVAYMDEKKADDTDYLEYLSDDIDNAYISYCSKLSIHNELTDEQKSAIKIVYSPLHGSGYVPVTKLLAHMGYKNVSVVERQTIPDGHFPTVKVPNPETQEAFTMALELAQQESADIALATDPDSDRLGVCIKTDTGYEKLTGNRIGSLLVHYILSSLKEKGELKDNSYVAQSIVSTDCTQKICDKFGVELKKLLTGFRYIAEQIENSDKNFIFGFEESYGFLMGTNVRDKDACLAAMLVSEACAYYKSQGKTLSDVLNEMDCIYGAFVEKCESFTVSGKDGMAKISAYMNKLHNEPQKAIAGYDVTKISDLDSEKVTDLRSGKTEKTDIPKANVVIFELGDNIKVCVRPSGTEPKLKLYFSVNADTRIKAAEILEGIAKTVSDEVNKELA